MDGPPGRYVTRILHAVGSGDPQAADALLPVVYSELRRLARHYLAGEPAGQTLQPTELVHEAYLRLVGGEEIPWEGRAHFFATAARAMRRILVDRARRRKTSKHGGNRRPITLDRIELADPQQDQPDLVLALHDALERLEAIDPRKADVVMLRYFAGMTVDETALALNLSSSTVKNEWRFSRAWLYRELTRHAGSARDAV